jgi:Ca2+-binding EF-hand superfamily protein
MFQLYDVDKNGVISYQEMLSIFRAGYKMNHNKSDPLRDEAALVEVRPIFVLNHALTLLASVWIWFSGV